MKLAKLGPLNRILGIQEVELGVPFTVKSHSLVGVSDETAQIVLDGAAANPKVFYFFEGGELTTFRMRRIHPN